MAQYLAPAPILLHMQPRVRNAVYRLLAHPNVRNELKTLNSDDDYQQQLTGTLAFGLLCALDGAAEKLGIGDWRGFAKSTHSGIEAGRLLLSSHAHHKDKAKKLRQSFWAVVDNAQLYLIAHNALHRNVVAYPGPVSENIFSRTLDHARLIRKQPSRRSDPYLNDAANSLLRDAKTWGTRSPQAVNAYRNLIGPLKRVSQYCERRLLYEVCDSRL